MTMFRPDLVRGSRKTPWQLSQPLKDQYVSKYTPERRTLSIAAGHGGAAVAKLDIPNVSVWVRARGAEGFAVPCLVSRPAFSRVPWPPMLANDWHENGVDRAAVEVLFGTG
jgi:hypothetical protein